MHLNHKPIGDVRLMAQWANNNRNMVDMDRIWYTKYLRLFCCLNVETLLFICIKYGLRAMNYFYNLCAKAD